LSWAHRKVLECAHVYPRIRLRVACVARAWLAPTTTMAMAWPTKSPRRSLVRSVALAVLLFALLTALAYRRARCWYAAYNARALEFFRKGLAAEARTAALDAQLRELAREAVAAIPLDKIRAFPAEIDVTITGGGFKVSYAAGVALALDALHTAHRGRGTVRRWSGASAGAMMSWSAIFGAFTPMLVWATTVIVRGGEASSLGGVCCGRRICVGCE
jgi:hypothetical protein